MSWISSDVRGKYNANNITTKNITNKNITDKNITDQKYNQPKT